MFQNPQKEFYLFFLIFKKGKKSIFKGIKKKKAKNFI